VWWVASGFLLPATPARGQAVAVEPDRWDFAATLDGKAIGGHHFAVDGPTTARRIISRADFDVRILGWSVYRYRHRAEERWEGDCLRSLSSETTDDGRRRQVEQHYDGVCSMGFSYWNPRLVEQRHLIDPQTGDRIPASFQRLPDGAIEVRGASTAAHAWRLVADTRRITLWYAASDGRWIGLDADVQGGRHLRYRLPADTAAR